MFNKKMKIDNYFQQTCQNSYQKMSKNVYIEPAISPYC